MADEVSLRRRKGEGDGSELLITAAAEKLDKPAAAERPESVQLSDSATADSSDHVSFSLAIFHRLYWEEIAQHQQ